MPNFVIHALPAGEIDLAACTARAVVADGPSPCRRCLRNAEVGDPLLLVPYNPFLVESPYAGEGPVFVHAEGCEPHEPVPGAISEQVNNRLLSLRAYDSDGLMVDSEVVGGKRFAQTADAMLADGAAFVHTHFAGPGCFAFRVDPS